MYMNPPLVSRQSEFCSQPTVNLQNQVDIFFIGFYSYALGITITSHVSVILPDLFFNHEQCDTIQKL